MTTREWLLTELRRDIAASGSIRNGGSMTRTRKHREACKWAITLALWPLVLLLMLAAFAIWKWETRR
jgi:hypothetical protein